jgi:hypothetical protein
MIEQGSLICMFLQPTEKLSQSNIVSMVANWLANNVNARILSIDFNKDNRFIEIIGTQMTS